MGRASILGDGRAIVLRTEPPRGVSAYRLRSLSHEHRRSNPPAERAMRPDTKRRGTTNGGKSADDFAFGTRLPPTIGNDTDQDNLGAPLRSRHRVLAKRWSIQVHYRPTKRRQILKLKHHY